MSCSLVNINHLVFSVPAYVPSSEKKRNCLVESTTEGDSGHRCVSLFPSMSENQSCKAFNCPQHTFNEQNVLSIMLSLMTQLKRSYSKISTVTTTTAAGISDEAKSKETLRGWVGYWLYMRLKGQPCEITTFPVLSLFFITALFITSLPVPSESICSQSRSKENASIWFLRLYNL